MSKYFKIALSEKIVLIEEFLNKNVKTVKDVKDLMDACVYQISKLKITIRNKEDKIYLKEVKDKLMNIS